MRRLPLCSLLFLATGCGSVGTEPDVSVIEGDTVVTVTDSNCCEDPCDDPCDDDGSSSSGGPEPEPDPVEACPCPDGYTPTPADDACVMETEFEATFSGVEYTVCEGNTLYVYGMYGAQLPDGAQIQNSFWGQDNGAEDGRLNEVGVWACDSVGTGVSDLPTGEWIGFTTCIELAEAGAYIVGIAGDNRVRFFVDGNLVFEKDSSDQNNFKRWYLLPIELSSGSHNVELLGKNDGNIAAFGAELYGPYALDDVATDAQIEALDINASHIVWSTGSQLGATFELGETSGWSCPDGTAFDMCNASPVCVEHLEEECLPTD